jgi:putative ABC transport system permease protein
MVAALVELRAHALRAGLATLGVVFGVGAVIAMLAIGAGAERQALEQIERLGRQNLVLRAKELPPEELRRVRERSIGLAWRDVAAIRQGLPGVVEVVPKISLQPYQVYADRPAPSATKVIGVGASYPQLVAAPLAEGRFFDPLEEQTFAQVCVLGAGARRALFGFGPALGRFVKVDDVWLEVVGVLAGGGGDADSFQGVSLGPSSLVLFLPVTTAERKFDRDALASPFAEIVVRLAAEVEPRQAARALARLIDRLHAGSDDVELVVPEALLAQSRRTQRLFDLVMGSIAGISLLVGGIGITNILLASVLERTREIGVRRAVGARQRDIRLQFLTEAFAISAVGGVAGILLGVGIAAAVGAWAGWPTVVEGWSVLLASGVAVGVGLLAGTYPAARAAALDPIDALRYE